jgi:hypothetical protein
MRLINLFEVAPEIDEVFLADWESARATLAGQDGFGAIVLYRALRSDVALRFVDVARVDAEKAAFAGHPSLYEIVHEEGAPDGTEGVTLISPFEVPAEIDAPSRFPRTRTSASWPAGSAPARRSQHSRATSGRACTAASLGPTCASSTSPAGRAR